MHLTLKEVFVKELVIYVISEDHKISEILHKHNAGGMVFYEVNGSIKTFEFIKILRNEFATSKSP